MLERNFRLILIEARKRLHENFLGQILFGIAARQMRAHDSNDGGI